LTRPALSFLIFIEISLHLATFSKAGAGVGKEDCDCSQRTTIRAGGQAGRAGGESESS